MLHDHSGDDGYNDDENDGGADNDDGDDDDDDDDHHHQQQQLHNGNFRGHNGNKQCYCLRVQSLADVIFDRHRNHHHRLDSIQLCFFHVVMISQHGRNTIGCYLDDDDGCGGGRKSHQLGIEH